MSFGVPSRLKTMKNLDRFVILICLLAIVGIFSLLFSYFHHPSISNTHRSSLNKPQPARLQPASQFVSGTPLSISLPSMDLSLAIVPGSADSKGNWTLTPNKAQYAIISPKANNREGNTVVYGHANKYVFGHLYLIKKGAIANVTTDNGYIFHYKYEGTYAVNPHDLSIFNYKGAPILTLQTCSGAFYQNRQMYQFAYQGFDKI